MKDLVEIIKKNQGCKAWIDNDCWELWKKEPAGFNDWDAEKQNEWSNKEGIIAKSGEVKALGSGYGSGGLYGGDILQALAKIVGIQIESA